MLWGCSVQDSCWLCVFWDELSGTLHGDYPAKNVWPKSKCDLSGQLPRSTCTILWWWNCKRQVCQCWHQCWIGLMTFLDDWNQLDVRLKACHQSEIAWRAFKGSEKKTAQLRPLAIFLTDWDSSLSSQNKSSHSIWRVFVNLLSGATGPACCAVAEGKKNQFASPICCCFQIHLAATVLMRPRVLSWTHPLLSRQSAIPLHFTCPAQWPADRRCGGGSVGAPIDSCRPWRWKFLDSCICLGVLRGMAMRDLASRTSELPGDLWLWNKRTRPLTCDSKRAQCALCICMICLKCLAFWGSAAVHWPLATLTVPWYLVHSLGLGVKNSWSYKGIFGRQQGVQVSDMSEGL